jgi:hypothetical protein
MPRLRFVAIAFAFVLVPLAASAKDAGTAKGGAGHVINDANTTTSVECTAESSKVVLNGSNSTITITGPCTEVAVNASHSKLTIASVDKLAVNGADNTVDVDAAGKIAVTGADNKVTYKKATGTAKAPKVANLGANNSIKKAP